MDEPESRINAEAGKGKTNPPCKRILNYLFAQS
jgi:hypothetical protein